MAQTFRDVTPYLVAVAGITQPDVGGGERLREGDIRAVAWAHPQMHVGTGQAQRCEVLWLYLETFGEIELDRLVGGNEEQGVTYDKRRYCIPLPRLRALAPTLNLARVRDPTDCYQPFLGDIDQDIPENYRYDEIGPLLDSEGASFAERSAVLAVLEDQILRKRLGRLRDSHNRINPLDTQKLQQRQVFRLPDGSFALSITSTCGYFFDTTPRHVFPVGGLVHDKARGRYL